MNRFNEFENLPANIRSEIFCFMLTSLLGKNPEKKYSEISDKSMIALINCSILLNISPSASLKRNLSRDQSIMFNTLNDLNLSQKQFLMLISFALNAVGNKPSHEDFEYTFFLFNQIDVAQEEYSNYCLQNEGLIKLWKIILSKPTLPDNTY